MHKKLKISQLKPNPFRRLASYPIDQEKIAALRESFRDTGWWGNIIARPDGKFFEIAYGHHRLYALTEELGRNGEVEVIVKTLSDADMIRIMARENMEEWRSNAAIETETIRATLDAYAAGRIDLGEVPTKTPGNCIHHAPHVLPQNENEGEHPYTKNMLAQFLGWTKGNRQDPSFAFETAFRALELIEQRLITESQLSGKKREEANVLLKETARAHRESMKIANAIERNIKQLPAAKQDKAKEEVKRLKAKASSDAKKVATELAKGFATGHVSRNEAKAKARQIIAPSAPAKTPKSYDFDSLTNEVVRSANMFFNGDDAISAKFEALVKFRDQLEPKHKKALASVFAKLISRIEKQGNRIASHSIRSITND